MSPETGFRDDFVACPRCKAPLDPAADQKRLVCEKCKGVLIAEADLAEAIQQAMPVEDRDASEAALVCPKCATPMQPKSLYGIELDHCAAHGLWFDGDELRRVLEAHERSISNARPSTAQKVAGGLAMAGIIALSIVRFLYF